MTEVTETTLDRVRRVVMDHMGLDEHEDEPVTSESRFEDDLAADSLDMIECTMALEEEFNIEISDAEAEKCPTVGDVVILIDRLLVKS